LRRHIKHIPTKLRNSIQRLQQRVDVASGSFILQANVPTERTGSSLAVVGFCQKFQYQPLTEILRVFLVFEEFLAVVRSAGLVDFESAGVGLIDLFFAEAGFRKVDVDLEA
jgi:hypothetical protein